VISEDDLHAYVDGRLSSTRAHEVELYLQAYPDAAARVADYQAQREALRAAFAPRLAEPLPSALNLGRLIEARLARRRAPWRVAAGVVLAFGLGGAGGWILGALPPRGIPALAREAAMSYAVYVADPHRPVELRATQRGVMIRWLSRRLDRTVAPPDLSAFGYRLLGGRLVATERGAAALFVYESNHATRLAVFVRPMAARDSTRIKLIDVGEHDGCAWIDRGAGYTVVGAEPYDRLLGLSRQVRKQARATG